MITFQHGRIRASCVFSTEQKSLQNIMQTEVFFVVEKRYLKIMNKIMSFLIKVDPQMKVLEPFLLQMIGRKPCWKCYGMLLFKPWT